MKKYVLLLFLVLQAFTNSAQSLKGSVHELFALAINRKGLFVERQPIRRLYLSLYDTMSIWRNGDKHLLIPARKLVELIRNNTSLDTAAWTSEELDSVVLIANRDGYLNVSAEMKRLHFQSAELAKRYTKSLRRFNNTGASDRNIVSFSRPIFDSSKTYALIESDNGYLLSGGGAIILYKRDTIWHEVGIIKRWAH